MICPTNEQLAAMTDAEVLGPPDATADHLCVHYPVQVGPYNADEWEADHDPGAASAVDGAC